MNIIICELEFRVLPADKFGISGGNCAGEIQKSHSGNDVNHLQVIFSCQPALLENIITCDPIREAAI